VKYVCLVYGEERVLEELDDAECLATGEALAARGLHLASEALESVVTATTVRVRRGHISVTDGPFAETKEQLAGFFLIEAVDLNEAIRQAAEIPAARLGSIEVRPIRQLGS
jgi:hypothetical protein